MKKQKTSKPISSITKSELDFNTNIFKQYYDETNKKQKPKTASIINNNNKRRSLNINSNVKEIKSSQLQEEKVLSNKNLSVSKSNNTDAISKQHTNAVEIHPSFQIIQQQQQIEIECKASQNIKQNTNERINNNDDKIKKQEEYKQMLDKQIEEQKMYKSQNYFIKQPALAPIPKNQTNYNQFNMGNNVSNSIERYQNIMEEFYDTKLKILNEQRQRNEQMLIQRYENAMNAMIDNKLNQLMNQSENEVKNDYTDDKAYLYHFENFVNQKSLQETQIDNKEEVEDQEENIMNFNKKESMKPKKEKKQNERISSSVKNSKSGVNEKNNQNKQKVQINNNKQNNFNVKPKKSVSNAIPTIKKSEQKDEPVIPQNTKYKIKRQTSKPKIINKPQEKQSQPYKVKPKENKTSLNNPNTSNNSHMKISSQPQFQEPQPKQAQAEDAINKLENIQNYISSLLNNYNK